MTLVEPLITELQTLPAYLDETRKLIGDISTLKEAQATTVAAKIQALGCIHMNDATRLKISIAKVGWTNEENKTLSKLVDEGVEKSDFASRKQSKRGTQYCAHWEMYPASVDWRMFEDTDTPWSVKFERCAETSTRR